MARKYSNPSPAEWVRLHARPLQGGIVDFDAVVRLAGDAHIVLLGGSTHGTAEFYSARAAITRRLVKEHGYSIVAIEGDWPAALQVNRYIQGGAGNASEALGGFRRFPAWLWRNNVILDLVDFLRRFNDPIPLSGSRVGIYGLDLFNLPGAITEAVGQLKHMKFKSARHALGHFACLGTLADDSREAAFGVHFTPTQCENEVLEAVREIQRKAFDAARRGQGESQFEAEIAALAVAHSEQYYRRLLEGDGGLWNLRDRHMAQVLGRLLAAHGPGAKAVVWAHNSHVGDMAATTEGAEGKINLCRILREKYGEEVVSVGFGTYEGTVTAAPDWDAEPEFMVLPPAAPGSLEAIFHDSGLSRCLLNLRALVVAEVPSDSFVYKRLPERVAGVVLNPARPDIQQYVSGKVAQKYDAYFFYDKTLAVAPLDAGPIPAGMEAYPTGE